MTRIVQAAGGLVFRRTANGKLEILLAHRPSYDDWSFPKGKADEGETTEQTALREVLEETGYHCRIVAPLGSTRYRIEVGEKQVSWFAMRPLPDSPGFEINPEIDQIKWVDRREAEQILDYVNDRNLMDEASLDRLSRTGTIHLYRHAAAGERTKWEADDRDRPLSVKGRRQAEAIAERLKGRGIERILTSPYARCVESVAPLATATGAEIEVDDSLAEGPDIEAAYELVESLVGYNAVVCSHGDVIPAVTKRMIRAGLTLDSRFRCSKGSIWEIALDGGRFTTGRYVPAPNA